MKDLEILHKIKDIIIVCNDEEIIIGLEINLKYYINIKKYRRKCRRIF